MTKHLLKEIVSNLVILLLDIVVKKASHKYI